MTLASEDKKALIEHRINRAWETKKEAVFLNENGMSAAAVSRIYYGMYYALTALSLSEGFKSNKHSQLIGWFNKNFIRTGIIDSKYSKIITRAFNKRMDGDYEDFTEFSHSEINEMIKECEKFIEMMQNMLSGK